MSLEELSPGLYKNRVGNPDETVYEVVTAGDGLGWGFAIADIGESELHFHEQTREYYLVLQGTLAVVLDGKTQVLQEGEGVLIPPGVKHEARGLGGKRVRIAAFTFPAWSPEDHHIVEANS